MDRLVVVLGNENDEEEELSEAAKERCDRAIAKIKDLRENSSETLALVVTGGFGEFNRSDTPHARLLRSRILEGLCGNSSQGAGLDPVHVVVSAGTHQDAIGVRSLLDELGARPKIDVITSDFHEKRAKAVFSFFFPDCCVKVHPVPHNAITVEEQGTDKEKQKLEEKKRLEDEESRKLQDFHRLRVDVFNARRSDASDLDRLHSELKHYDNLSYFTLVAAFLVVAFAYRVFEGQSSSEKAWSFDALRVLSLFAVSAVLLLLYSRFASTASSARNSLKELSFYLCRGGLHSSQAIHNRFSPNVQRAIGLLFFCGWFAVIVEVFYR